MSAQKCHLFYQMFFQVIELQVFFFHVCVSLFSHFSAMIKFGFYNKRPITYLFFKKRINLQVVMMVIKENKASVQGQLIGRKSEAERETGLKPIGTEDMSVSAQLGCKRG